MCGGESREGRGNTHKGRLTPQKLFDQGNYQRATEMLVECPRQNHAETNRRLLAESLLFLDDETRILEALRHFQEIEHKSVHDLLRIGWCWLELMGWDGAIAPLEVYGA